MIRLWSVLAIACLCFSVQIQGQEDTLSFWDRTNYEVLYSRTITGDRSGYSMSISGWYFVTPVIGLGPHMAYYDFNGLLNETYLAPGLSAIYIKPLSQRLTSFGSVHLSYGIPRFPPEIMTEQNEGGILFYPHIGLIWKTKRQIGFSFSGGYVRQQMKAGIFEGFEGLTFYRIVYERYQISLGLVF